MKCLTAIVLTIILIVTLCVPVDAQILWRSAKTMKQGSVIAMAEWYLMNCTKSYDWTGDKWVDFPDDSSRVYSCYNFMVGYGISDRLEASIHIPVLTVSAKNDTIDKSATGLGDIFLKTRLALIEWAKDKHGLTMTTALRFPTGNWNSYPSTVKLNLGDGSTDFGVGLIFSTAWMGNFRGHLKSNWWINNVKSSGDNVGDELKTIVKADYNMTPKVMPFLTYIYYSKGKDKDTDGIVQDKTRKISHTFVLGGVWKPQKGVFIRPKIDFPLGGKGGSIYSFKPVLDFWYIFQL